MLRLAKRCAIVGAVAAAFTGAAGSASATPNDNASDTGIIREYLAQTGYESQFEMFLSSVDRKSISVIFAFNQFASDVGLAPPPGCARWE